MRTREKKNMEKRQHGVGTRLLLMLVVQMAAVGGAQAREVPVTVVSTRTETVKVNTPDNYNGSDALPLAVMLHGLGNSGPLTSRRWNMEKAGNDKNFHWVAPTGPGRRWCGAGCCGCSSDRDSKFLRAMVEQIIEEPGINVDESRIFFMGISNGGFMSYRMACDHADLIAGIMPVCGANYRNFERSCNPSEPVNILHIHGTRDALIRYSTAEPSVRGWAGNQCSGGNTVSSSEHATVPSDHHWGTDLGRVEVKKFTNCEADVELWTAPGVGHCPQASWANMNWLLARPKRGKSSGGGGGSGGSNARQAPGTYDDAFLWELIIFLQTADDGLDPATTARFLAFLDEIFDAPVPAPAPAPPQPSRSSSAWPGTGLSPEGYESLSRMARRPSSGSKTLTDYLSRLRSGKSTVTLSEFDQSTVFAKNEKCSFPFEHEGVWHESCVFLGESERCKDASGNWQLCYALDENLFGEEFADPGIETHVVDDGTYMDTDVDSIDEFDLGALLLADIALDDDSAPATAAAYDHTQSSNTVSAQTVQRFQRDGSACVFPMDFQGQMYSDCVEYADAEWCVNAQNEWAECT